LGNLYASALVDAGPGALGTILMLTWLDHRS
jgi:hypothetical protein